MLESWKSATTDMPAPWRQTAGAGGSEFGKLKWFAALKYGFKTGETPHFKLWQLALADHVVRMYALHIDSWANQARLWACRTELTNNKHAFTGTQTH